MFGTGPCSPTQRKGLQFEKLALKYLRRQGLKIRCRNYHCRFGEIDLIFTHGQTLIFVEVRYRATTDFGLPHETVDRRKQQKLIKCAQSYLMQQGLYERCDARFDIVSICDDAGNTQIKWLKNAFTAS